LPNFDPAWLLLAFPVAIIAFAVRQSRQTEKGRSGGLGPPNDRPSQQNDPNSPSTDIAALIHAIHSEGRANRREEIREDRGKKVRDWITILLIGATLYAVWRQVEEMRRVYGPITEQAKAATDTETRQLRAYVFSIITRFSPSLQTNIPNIFSTKFVNGGSTPAYVLSSELKSAYIDMPLKVDVFDAKPPSTQGWSGTYLFKEHTSEYNSLPLYLTTDQVDAVKNSLGGVFFWGHIFYKDVFGCVHHTNFCMGYYSQRGAGPATYECIAHNDVDSPDRCDKE
jgi:hypothetical protein